MQRTTPQPAVPAVSQPLIANVRGHVAADSQANVRGESLRAADRRRSGGLAGPMVTPRRQGGMGSLVLLLRIPSDHGGDRRLRGVPSKISLVALASYFARCSIRHFVGPCRWTWKSISLGYSGLRNIHSADGDNSVDWRIAREAK